MKAYLILDCTIMNRPAFMECVEKIPEYIRKHKGHYLVAGRTPQVLAGDWHPDTIVLLEFDSPTNLENFPPDTEVKTFFKIHHQHANSKRIQVNGGSWKADACKRTKHLVNHS